MSSSLEISFMGLNVPLVRITERGFSSEMSLLKIKLGLRQRIPKLDRSLSF